jgi:hypothetical protein
MNRHARITERVDKKNARLHFVGGTTNVAKTIIKEYKKLYENLLFIKVRGLEKEEWINRVVQLQSKMAKNKQTKDLVNQINWGTFDFAEVHNTVLVQYIDSTKHISRF